MDICVVMYTYVLLYMMDTLVVYDRRSLLYVLLYMTDTLAYVLLFKVLIFNSRYTIRTLFVLFFESDDDFIYDRHIYVTATHI